MDDIPVLFDVSKEVINTVYRIVISGCLFRPWVYQSYWNHNSECKTFSIIITNRRILHVISYKYEYNRSRDGLLTPLKFISKNCIAE